MSYDLESSIIARTRLIRGRLDPNNSGVWNIHLYWSIRWMFPCTTQVLDRGTTLKNKSRGETYPIREVSNPMFLEHVLDTWVHIPMDGNMNVFI